MPFFFWLVSILVAEAASGRTIELALKIPNVFALVAQKGNLSCQPDHLAFFPTVS